MSHHQNSLTLPFAVCWHRPGLIVALHPEQGFSRQPLRHKHCYWGTVMHSTAVAAGCDPSVVAQILIFLSQRQHFQS